MSTISATIEIDAPIDVVFAKYAQYDRHPEWQPGLVHAELDGDGDMVTGTRGTEVRKLFGREATFPYVVTEHDPPRCSAFRTLSGPLRPEGTASFTALDAGGTRMEFSMTLGAQGLLKVLEPLLAVPFARQTQRDLARFRPWVQRDLDASTASR